MCDCATCGDFAPCPLGGACPNDECEPCREAREAREDEDYARTGDGPVRRLGPEED